MYSRVPECQVTTYYYVGFAYLMMRRYQDAIRVFANILLYIQRTKSMFQRATYKYEMVRAPWHPGRWLGTCHQDYCSSWAFSGRRAPTSFFCTCYVRLFDKRDDIFYFCLAVVPTFVQKQFAEFSLDSQCLEMS